MKRRKLKAVSQTGANLASAITNREATDLPLNARIASVLVQDVYEPEKRQVAILSLRDDPLGALWARHQIDDAKYIAGRRWQQYYETVQGFRGQDVLRTPVDGGGNGVELFTDARRHAVMHLAHCTQALGRDGDGLVRDVLGQGMFLLQAAAIRNQSAIYVGARFRECLECLAREFGYA